MPSLKLLSNKNEATSITLQDANKNEYTIGLTENNNFMLPSNNIGSKNNPIYITKDDNGNIRFDICSTDSTGNVTAEYIDDKLKNYLSLQLSELVPSYFTSMAGNEIGALSYNGNTLYLRLGYANTTSGSLGLGTQNSSYITYLQANASEANSDIFLTLPYDNGILATQEWIINKNYRLKTDNQFSNLLLINEEENKKINFQLNGINFGKEADFIFEPLADSAETIATREWIGHQNYRLKTDNQFSNLLLTNETKNLNLRLDGTKLNKETDFIFEPLEDSIETVATREWINNQEFMLKVNEGPTGHIDNSAGGPFATINKFIFQQKNNYSNGGNNDIIYTQLINEVETNYGSYNSHITWWYNYLTMSPIKDLTIHSTNYGTAAPSGEANKGQLYFQYIN